MSEQDLSLEDNHHYHEVAADRERRRRVRQEHREEHLQSQAGTNDDADSSPTTNNDDDAVACSNVPKEDEGMSTRSEAASDEARNRSHVRATEQMPAADAQRENKFKKILAKAKAAKRYLSTHDEEYAGPDFRPTTQRRSSEQLRHGSAKERGTSVIQLQEKEEPLINATTSSKVQPQVSEPNAKLSADASRKGRGRKTKRRGKPRKITPDSTSSSSDAEGDDVNLLTKLLNVTARLTISYSFTSPRRRRRKTPNFSDSSDDDKVSRTKSAAANARDREDADELQPERVARQRPRKTLTLLDDDRVTLPPTFNIARPMYIWVTFAGTKIHAETLIYFGAQVSTIPRRLFEDINKIKPTKVQQTDIQIRTGDNTPVACTGVAKLTFQFSNLEFTYELYIAEDTQQPILGCDFLNHTGDAKLSLTKPTVIIHGVELELSRTY